MPKDISWINGLLNSSNTPPVFNKDLNSTTPTPPTSGETRASQFVDGYSSINDGGQGQFFWLPGYNGPDTPISRVATGGGWMRLIQDSTVTAASFGVKADATGTIDAIVQLQQAADSGHQALYLDDTVGAAFDTGHIAQPCPMIAISHPFCLDDLYTSTPTGNTLKRLRGAGRNRIGLMPTMLTPGNVGTQSWIGPLLIIGNNNWPGPTYVTDSTGSWGSATCLVSGGAGSPFLNFSQYDTGTINGQSQLGLEFEWNILTDTPGPGYEYLLASSYGNLPNLTSAASSALQIIRTDAFGYKQIVAIFVTSAGQFFVRLPYLLDFTPSTKQVLGFSYDGTNAYLALDGQLVMFSPITSSGPGTPPAVTFTGTPTAAHVYDVEIDGTGTFKWRVDGGSYTTGVAYTAGGAAVALSAGTSVLFPALGTYAVGQHWTVGTGTPVVPVTGTVSQLWYEEVVIGLGGFAAWPQTTNVFFSGSNFHLGRSRLSKVALFTSNYTPDPAGWTCDSNTKVINDFAPANQGTTYRASLADWNVARTGAMSPSGSARSNMPLWLWVHANTLPYHDNCQVEDIFFCNPQGEAIFLAAASNSQIRNLNVLGYKGIEWQQFSFPIRIENCALIACGDNGSGHGQKIGLYFGAGSQGIYVGPNMSYSGTVDWDVVCTGGDLWMGPSLPASGAQGFLYVSGALSVVVEGVSIDDESNVSRYAHFAVGSATKFHFRGPFIDSNTSALACGFKIGSCLDPIIGTQPALQSGVPIFSFGPAKNNGIPVQWDAQLDFGVGGTTVTVIDPSHIGSVIVPSQERFGVHSLTQADADYTMTQPDQFWGHIAVGGATTAKRKMIQAVHNPGKFTEWQNNTTGSPANAFTVIGPSGTGVDIPADGAWHRVFDNGTNIVAA